MTIPSTEPLIYATLGGLVPALVWLLFFLREDSVRPEPKPLIIVSFLSGMLAVVLVLPVELYIQKYASSTNPLFLWAAAEELMKYLVALVVVLWRHAVDEPVDMMVYMVTVALGFAALESTLFVLTPFVDYNITEGLLTGNLRFMGAALIHTLCSAVVGGALALSYYKSDAIQLIYLCTGLFLATTLHALFNFFIISSSGTGTAMVFFVVWLGVIAMFLLFEQAKRVKS